MSLIKVRKITSLDGEDKRDGKDSIVADAQFKVGDRVKVDAKYSSNVNGGVGIISDIKNGDVVVEFTGHGNVRVPALYVQSADSSFAADAKFKVGDLVRMSEGGLTGKITKIEPNGHFRVSFLYNKANGFSQSFSANEIVMVKPAADAAELRVVHAKGVGKWWVEPNLSRFNDADREQTHKGRKEFPDREAAIKYARGTGKTFIVNDACEDSAAKFRIGQEVIVKTKFAEPYKARIVGLWDMSQNGPYNEQGYLIKNIKGGGVESMPEHALSLVTAKDADELNNDADLHAADASGKNAKFQKGDKVRVWQQPVYGKMGEIVEATFGGMEYTVNVEGKDYPRIDYRRIVKVSNTAGDAAEFHVGQRVRAKDPRWTGYQGHALGNGVYTVKKVDRDGTVKLDGFLDVWISPTSLVEANDACGKGEDAEKFRVGQKVRHTRFGTIGKVFEIAPDGGIGVQWSNGQAYYGKFHLPLSEIVAVDACKDSSELNNDADLRAALSKMADIAKRLTDAKVSFKAGWTPDGIGEIILEFPNIESARKYNYYKLFNAWEAARSQIVPRWAVNIGGYRVPRIEGNRMTISILHFST